MKQKTQNNQSRLSSQIQLDDSGESSNNNINSSNINNNNSDEFSNEALYEALVSFIKKAGHKFEFGYFSKDDLQNEGWILIKQNIHKFNSKRGTLDSFVSTLLGSRFRNLYRKKCRRTELPCYNCKYDGWDRKNQKCVLFENMMECHLYRDWFYRNNAKANLLSPEIIYEDPTTVDDTPLETMIKEEEYQAFKVSLDPSNAHILEKLVGHCTLSIIEIESLKTAFQEYSEE